MSGVRAGVGGIKHLALTLSYSSPAVKLFLLKYIKWGQGAGGEGVPLTPKSLGHPKENPFHFSLQVSDLENHPAVGSSKDDLPFHRALLSSPVQRLHPLTLVLPPCTSLRLALKDESYKCTACCLDSWLSQCLFSLNLVRQSHKSVISC